MDCTISIYNQFFTLIALLGFVASLTIYSKKSQSLTKIVRSSFVGMCLAALFVSLYPTYALLLVIAFLPAFMYHTFAPLTMIVFLIWPLAWVASFCGLVLLREIAALLTPTARPAQFRVSLVALIIVGLLTHVFCNGLVDYKIAYNANAIFDYAATGADVGYLQKIYRAVAAGRDVEVYRQTLLKLAHNPHTPSALLRMIYTHTMESHFTLAQRNFIFTLLSANPQTPADLLKKLVLTNSKKTAESTQVLALAPHNPNFSYATLVQLINYPDCEIRRALLNYPGIEEKLLRQMTLRDPDLGVRRDAKRRLDFLHGNTHLASAPLANKYMLPAGAEQDSVDKLALDQAGPDAKLLKSAENCQLEPSTARTIFHAALAKQGYAKTAVLLALAANPQTPPDILRRLAQENELIILRSLAANAHLPMDVIQTLAPFPDCKIRKEIICLPAADTAQLNNLRADKDESVAQEATERLRESSAYLNVCREFRKINTLCQQPASAAPLFRRFPNTSALVTPIQPLAAK